MEKLIKILLIEDNLNDVELIRYQISKYSAKCEFKHVSQLDEFSIALDEYIPDIILSDYNLVGFTGLDVLEIALQKCKLTPFIIVTGTIDEETAAETIKKGAWDYIVKERLTRLDSAMTNALKLKEEKAKSAESRHKLRISEERFKLAIEGSQDGIWDWDIINDKIFYSKRWKSMLGYQEHEIENDIHTWEDLLHPDDKEFTIDAFNRHLRKETDSYQVETRLKCKDGSYKWIFDKGKAIFDENDKPYRVAGSHTDISERKLMEYELIRSKEKAVESDKLKTEFINNMSHEIRTPMNGILGFSSFLNNPNLSDVKRKHYVSIIQNSGNQLMRIIDDILEISKLGTKQVKIIEQEVCLNDLLLEHFSIFDIKAKENKTPLYFNKGLSDIDSTIITDKTKLNKILSNLLENALKFTTVGFIEIGYALKNNKIEIYIKDTGIGIKKEKQQTIFDRFSQEEKSLEKNVGGLGLGLSIAKENAELLGGKITLESEKGSGSTFFVTIPYKTVYLNTDNSKSLSNVDQEKFTVLIVEDEEVNYLYIDTLLSDENEINFNTIHAKNGQEAFDICKVNNNIDFVLMDMKMPIMNGFEATKLIKEMRPELPIIAQTAYSTDSDKGRAFSAGCDDFISKPISEATLNGVMKKYLK